MFQRFKPIYSALARVFQKSPNQEILDAIACNERIDPRYANELRAILARYKENPEPD